MPNVYKRKTDRDFDPVALKRAVKDVLINKHSIRRSAAINGVKKSRLALYVKKAADVGIDQMEFTPDFAKSQILSPGMESALEEYLLKSAAMFYGLTPKLVRRFAFDYAKTNNRKVPERWDQDQMATESWFTNFMRRHPRLSVRKPEATSLARMTSFNKTNVEHFQNKLQEVLARYSFTPAQIFNLDETGVTTVQRVQKIVGRKGEHQIGKVTSRERGELMTQVGIICANGNALPPVWIFPRQRFDPARMMKGVGEEPMGLAYHSGWMTCHNFIKVLEHFVKYVKCNAQDRVLLIMDNHESHVSLDAVEFCRANGIVILTLPPHTSNKLQPLDRTVFGPFKTFFNQAADAWMLSNPGKTLTIYDLPLMCLQAWDRAATPVNIKSGFRCTGIVPFDRNIFREEEFLSSAVTDRPIIESTNIPSTSSAINAGRLSASSEMSRPFDDNNDNDLTRYRDVSSPVELTPDVNPDPQGQSKISFVSPEVIRPYPKAAARKENTRGRKRGRCMIATDTPEKILLEEKARDKKAKAVKRKVLNADDEHNLSEISVPTGFNAKLSEVKSPGKKRRVKEVMKDESSDDDDDNEVQYAGNSSDESFHFEEDRETKEVSKGDYIVANVYGKSCVKKFVAIVDDIDDEGYEVRFLKRNFPSNRFTFTNEPIANVSQKDIVCVLPKPLEDKRARFQGMVYFNIDLTDYGLV